MSGFSPRKTGLYEGSKFLSLKQTVFFTAINLAIIDLNYYPNRLVPIKRLYQLTLYLRLIPVFRKCCQSLAFNRQLTRFIRQNYSLHQVKIGI